MSSPTRLLIIFAAEIAAALAGAALLGAYSGQFEGAFAAFVIAMIVVVVGASTTGRYFGKLARRLLPLINGSFISVSLWLSVWVLGASRTGTFVGYVIVIAFTAVIAIPAGYTGYATVPKDRADEVGE
jgi:hypothetical protein